MFKCQTEKEITLGSGVKNIINVCNKMGAETFEIGPLKEVWSMFANFLDNLCLQNLSSN